MLMLMLMLKNFKGKLQHFGDLRECFLFSTLRFNGHGRLNWPRILFPFLSCYALVTMAVFGVILWCMH